MTDLEAYVRIKQDNDQEALGWVYKTHREKFVHWFILRRHLTMDDALSIYHDCIVAFVQNIREGAYTYQGAAISTYLIQTGKNMIREGGRKKTRWEHILHELHETHSRQEQAFSARDEEALLNRIEQTLHSMPDPCHTLLTMFYLHKKNYTDIVNAMDDYHSEDAAKNQKARCLKKLRDLIFNGSSPLDL